VQDSVKKAINIVYLTILSTTQIMASKRLADDEYCIRKAWTEAVAACFSFSNPTIFWKDRKSRKKQQST
jgi:hypothetical protein